MRLWSIHPKYLDRQGLLALWRESLLAKKVLSGKTTGYKSHPQLKRFKITGKSLKAINLYLSYIYQEAGERGYKFSRKKFYLPQKFISLPVSNGQIKFEFRHLKKKLKQRDRALYNKLRKVKLISVHPMIKVVRGGVEDWEKR